MLSTSLNKVHVVIGASETDRYLLGVFSTWAAAQAKWHVIDAYEIVPNEMGVTWISL